MKVAQYPDPLPESFELQLNRVAEGYRAQGYQVIVRPGPEALPPFARDFHLEILATRPDGNVLASVKKNRLDMQADPDLSRYAGVIEHQPGWRLDLFILEPTPREMVEWQKAQEPSEEELHRSLADVEHMLRAGFASQSLLAAMTVLEAVMRRRLRAEGTKVDWKSSPRWMLTALYSAGGIPVDAFPDLESLLELRTVLIHGFAVPRVEPSAVQLFLDTARSLLDESELMKQTA
jgi:hypothetical protein